jgi:tRNA1(Val) A37 N6-methylase TrmN6
MKDLNICYLAALIVSTTTGLQFQAPKSDLKFWKSDRILLDEPKGSWPNDATNCLYVGDWSYWYRKKGMQTSTDDILVAFVATYPEADEHFFEGIATSSNQPILLSHRKAAESGINRYVDLGCGVGSTLLLVTYILRPKEFSIGIEAQDESFRLLQRTLDELPSDSPNIKVAHADIRALVHNSHASTSKESDESSEDNLSALKLMLAGKCDLITANPPYAPLQSGTLCKDAQRRSARFELRGGVEEYLVTVKDLLSHTGRFVLAFWSRSDDRVRKAVEAVGGLQIHRRFNILMGEAGRSDPHLSIYDIRHQPLLKESKSTAESEILIIDITRDPLTGGLNKKYDAIRSLLRCAPRPLKHNSANTRNVIEDIITTIPAVAQPPPR